MKPKSVVTPPRRFLPAETVEVVMDFADIGPPEFIVRGRRMKRAEFETLGWLHIKSLPEEGYGPRLACDLPRRPALLSSKLRASLGWQADVEQLVDVSTMRMRERRHSFDALWFTQEP